MIFWLKYLTISRSKVFVVLGFRPAGRGFLGFDLAAFRTRSIHLKTQETRVKYLFPQINSHLRLNLGCLSNICLGFNPIGGPASNKTVALSTAVYFEGGAIFEIEASTLQKGYE